ncbi:DUF3324 domain-containing protein [Aerococcus agrisoli]|uniref:DUF3324 domain-containing protein n=1 Tax=Aerococcus agrisoli TaxID=2487350 RepID=A0A3N4GJG0_9LACT|nr:DUF916 and DUF3324 domain-containing protein [Aerococcus agrisoli]RPA60726.1 DUF3324 domain-containing protein [Aerococcus agrisoli]
MRKFIQHVLVALFISLVTATTFVRQVSATEENTIGYTVYPVLPENQLTPQVSYFDLRVAPEDQQTLQVEVINEGTEPVTVGMELVNASTNANGLVVYDAELSENPDETLTNPVTEWATLEQDEVTVAVGESEFVNVNLDVPEEAFDGVKLGGIIFTEVKDDSTESSSEGFAVSNTYAYAMALQVSENDTEIAPDFKVKNVTPQVSDGARSVVVDIQNPQPKLTGGVTIQTDIRKQNDEEILVSETMENAEFAPNSTMPLVIEWPTEMEAGTYVAKITMTRGEDVWEEEKTFTIEKEASDQINEDAVVEPTQTTKQVLPAWFIPAAIVVGILILAMIGYIIYLQRKTKKNDDQTKA